MKQNLNLISNIKTHGYCAGCGLCASIVDNSQIEMQMNASGYLRPIAKKALSQLQEDEIKQVCPGVNVSHTKKANAHPIWGPLVKVRTGFAQDKLVRQQGSSGGVISALAIYLLAHGKVDYVLQTAASKTSPLVNVLQKSSTREDVINAAGSRYAPSAPLENIIALLQTGEIFAFIGKPCDVAGLRAFVKQNPQYQKQIKYIISFMCAGIPSIKGTHEVLNYMGADANQLESFRYRGDGWPGNAKAIQKDGKVFEMDYNTSWGNILGKHLQFRCKICPDGTGEFADVVCADAWYGKDGYPDFTEREGRSLLLSRTALGEALIKEALSANAIEVENLDVAEIAKMQPYQVSRKQVVLGRVFAAGFVNKHFVRYNNMGLVKASLTSNPIIWLKNAWGTYKRTKGEQQ